MERDRTPRPIIEVGIRLHLAELSLPNTISEIDSLGVKCSRIAVHNWVQKAYLQPTSDRIPNQIVLDETVIRVNDGRHWLYAVVDPATNEFLHARLFQTRTTQLTVLFLRELRDKQHIEQARLFVDGAHHLRTALTRLGLRFQVCHHGNRTAVERIFREVKRRTSSFSNTFSYVEPSTAETWLQAFASRHNSRLS